MLLDFVGPSRSPIASEGLEIALDVEHGSQLWHVGDDVHPCLLGFAGVFVELRELVDELLQFDRGYMRLESGD